MTRMIGEFRIGEDMRLALDAVEGNVADIATVTAQMRPAVRGPSEWAADPAATAVALTVAPRAASGDIPAGWNLSLLAAATVNLTAGVYAIDARLVGTASTIDITDSSAIIRFSQGAI